MKALALSLLTLSLALTAQAGVKEDFAAVNQIAKGPFGLNMLQGPKSRVGVNGGPYPSPVYFQAAYRNDNARALVSNYGMYLGNLFTTNYYELMGEYVYGDADSNHPVNAEGHAALIANGANAIGKANLMVQNWVLEKAYLQMFHDSRISRAFRQRGIGGSEFEQPYANYFFNFYLSSMNGDFQYLPAFLLVNKSPIVESESLQKARDLATNTYDYFNANLGTNHPMTKAIYKIRNAVHNQLSRDIIRLIDEFDRNYPEYRRDGHTYLFKIREILVAYYSFGPDKIAKQAAKLGFGDLRQISEKIAAEGVNSGNLLELSRSAADYRTMIADPAFIETDKRALTLALLSTISQFLNRELRDISLSPASAEAVVNLVYVEGFLIKDNWEFFAEEARSGSAPSTTLTDVIDVATTTLSDAFAQAYPLWLEAEPKMQYFMDNTVKSSALATAAAAAQKGN